MTAEVARLRATIEQLERDKTDLQIALQTTAEHGDAIERDLYEANQQLRVEIAERERAQAALQEILATVTRDKQDLELILEATTQHGDTVEYQLYTQAVEAMQESETLLRAISESTSILMILTQRSDGAIAYANPVSGQQLGLSVDQLSNYRLNDFFVHGDDFAQMTALLETQGVVHDYEVQIRRQDGATFWVSASMCSIELRGQETLLTTLYDISDRKQAEQALHDSKCQLQNQAELLEQLVAQRTRELQETEQKFRGIFENAVMGIFQVSPKGHYTSANPALAKIYGYDSPTALIQSVVHIGQLYKRTGRWEEILVCLRQEDSITDFESEVCRCDGTAIWVSENVRAVKDENGQVLCYEGSVRDITLQRTAEEEFHKQRKLSERLLLNVLPQPIAEQLKRGKQIIADRFSKATVLFADIVNFTSYSASHSPEEVVDLLNRIFSEFDALVKRHDLEKIKTIGDAYMLVSGVPTPRDDHISAAANMALDMLAVIQKFRSPCGQPVTLRIGIHTGPVVGGVISKHRFTYDLWGDTVNVTSRMESQGEAGRIQVTDAVYQQLKNDYLFQERGLLMVKGKGLMSTYWLLGRRVESSEASPPDDAPNDDTLEVEARFLDTDCFEE